MALELIQNCVQFPLAAVLSSHLVFSSSTDITYQAKLGLTKLVFGKKFIKLFHRQINDFVITERDLHSSGSLFISSCLSVYECRLSSAPPPCYRQLWLLGFLRNHVVGMIVSYVFKKRQAIKSARVLGAHSAKFAVFWLVTTGFINFLWFHHFRLRSLNLAKTLLKRQVHQANFIKQSIAKDATKRVLQGVAGGVIGCAIQLVLCRDVLQKTGEDGSLQKRALPVDEKSHHGIWTRNIKGDVQGCDESAVILCDCRLLNSHSAHCYHNSLMLVITVIKMCLERICRPADSAGALRMCPPSWKMAAPREKTDGHREARLFSPSDVALSSAVQAAGSGAKDAMREGPAMTSRSCDRDVITGPALIPTLGTEAAACTAHRRQDFTGLQGVFGRSIQIVVSGSWRKHPDGRFFVRRKKRTVTEPAKNA
ncbi:unnamed protein product [Ranitomeya imitator]|uniref:Uncharacterized protein n=1 Tax=Ranitomeya imitator TaxID=111125 RepID=A0ABN9MF65_9NEOB|nr:unnamed protein product [Ranitomeya imitator]